MTEIKPSYGVWQSKRAEIAIPQEEFEAWLKTLLPNLPDDVEVKTVYFSTLDRAVKIELEHSFKSLEED